MQDVNTLWDKYKNVIYTTSITVGISYDSEYTFDNLMLHLSCCSSTVRDMCQSSLRARKITNNVLYYSRYSHYNGDKIILNFKEID
jgi:CDP-diacylglycerol pyrophosphatase